MIEKTLIYKNELNVEGFIKMLDNPSECYKFYWLDAIMTLFSRGKTEISFNDLVDQMIAGAWYSVNEYHLHLGPKDAEGNVRNSLERAVIILHQLSNLDSNASESEIKLEIEKHNNNANLHKAKQVLIANVPYRLLSSYMPELKLKENLQMWNQTKRLIAYIGEINEKEPLPYVIVDGRSLDKKIVISEQWQQFLADNYCTISGWVELNKVRYLQSRNPDVPGIIYKLRPENDKLRKLSKVRDLWSAITAVTEVKDIYNFETLKCGNYDIDHFIPWSYVANDELWNLIPMDSSLNSSKSNKLPEWEKYFEPFAGQQYMMFQASQKYEKIGQLFQKCKRDNLILPWSLEQLYVEECPRQEFYNLLDKKLRPIYDSARMQGYSVWAY